MIFEGLTDKQLKALRSVNDKSRNFRKYKKENQFTELALAAIKAEAENFEFVDEHLITDEFIDKAVELNGRVLEFLPYSDKTYERCLKAVQNSPTAFRMTPIEYRTEELMKKTLEYGGYMLGYMSNVTYEMCKIAVQSDGTAIEHIEEQTEELCWMALKSKPFAISLIKEPTEEMLLYAMRQDGFLIRKIENPSEKVCLEAVRFVVPDRRINKLMNYRKFGPLQFIKNQTERICLEAVKTNGLALAHCKIKTPEIQMVAYEQNPEAIEYFDM